MKSVWFFAFTFLLTLVTGLQLKAKTLSSPLVDEAGMIPRKYRGEVEHALQQLRARNDIWMVVWTTPSLNGQAIEEAAVKKFEEWKIGKEGKDNGLLLVIAQNDRKMRLEVGYGLEGDIPDVTASRLLDHYLKPALRANNFTLGLLNLIANLGNTKALNFPLKQFSLPERQTGPENYMVIFFFGLPILVLSLGFIKKTKTQIQNLDLKFRPYLTQLGKTKKYMRAQSYVLPFGNMSVFAAVAYFTLKVFHFDAALEAVTLLFLLIFVVVIMGILKYLNYVLVRSRILNLSTKDEDELKRIFEIGQNAGGGGGHYHIGYHGGGSSGWSSGSGSSSSSSFSGGGRSGGGGASGSW